MSPARLLALALVLLSIPALSNATPAPPQASYLNVHGEIAARYPGEAFTIPSGLYLDWGNFQSRYVATGTRLGVSRSDPALGIALFFGGGPQFHFRIENDLLLIPSLNVGYRISQQGLGLLGTASLAFAYLRERFYFGVEGETLAFGQNASGWFLFPGSLSIQGLFGFYYD